MNGSTSNYKASAQQKKLSTRQRDNHANGKIFFASNASDKGLSKIYKEFVQLNNNNNKNPQKIQSKNG